MFITQLINLSARGRQIVTDFLTKGHQRTIKAKKNIITSFGFKGFSILVSFLIVPLTLNYLNPIKYGIWLTLSSIIAWFGIFDLGLGNGLRNKLSEAFANRDIKLAKIYISTTYAVLVLTIGIIYVIFLTLDFFLDWTRVLNTTPEMASELSWIAVIVFSFFSLQFVLKLIAIIFTADQLPAYSNAFEAIGNLIAFIAIFIISKYSNGSLLYISIAYGAAPVVILIIASIYYFNGRYRYLKPNFKSINIKYFKPLAGLGVKFFFLQITVIVIFSTDNLIIAQVLGPEEVTPYNIAFKYFSIIIMVFTIILTPYWSAYTDAITNNDMKWIKISISKFIKVWLLCVLSVLVLLASSQYFYLHWVGDKLHIPFMLSAFMGLFAIISTWNNIFAYFINGAGKIKLQMYYSIFAMIINIPLSLYFAKDLELGSTGVIIGTCISLAIGSILAPIQTFKIINRNANGIWNK